MKAKARKSGKARFDVGTFTAEPRPLSGSLCRVDEFKKLLSSQECASFLSALHDPTIPVPAVFRVAKRYGYRGQLTSLYGHRQNRESCHRCRRFAQAQKAAQ